MPSRVHARPSLPLRRRFTSPRRFPCRQSKSRFRPRRPAISGHDKAGYFISTMSGEAAGFGEFEAVA